MNEPSSSMGSRAELAVLFERFPRCRVALLGDFFLDRYLVVDPALAQPSLETGLPANQVVAVRNSPGAAGTVANNLWALGAGRVEAIGVIGDDGYGLELVRQLQSRGVLTDALLARPDRWTPTYLKPMAAQPGPPPERELGRFDIIDRRPIAPETESALCRALIERADQTDAIIVLDQMPGPGSGVVSPRVRRLLAELAAARPRCPVFADSRHRLHLFEGVGLKANEHEALAAAGLSQRPDAPGPPQEPARQAGRILFSRTGGRPVVITMGANGSLVTDATGQSHVPALHVSGPIDVTGAGDSFMAAFVLSLGAGAGIAQAAFVGNLAASITIGQLGTTGTASPAQMLARCDELFGSPQRGSCTTGPEVHVVPNRSQAS